MEKNTTRRRILKSGAIGASAIVFSASTVQGENLEESSIKFKNLPRDSKRVFKKSIRTKSRIDSKNINPDKVRPLLFKKYIEYKGEKYISRSGRRLDPHYVIKKMPERFNKKGTSIGGQEELIKDIIKRDQKDGEALRPLISGTKKEIKINPSELNLQGNTSVLKDKNSKYLVMNQDEWLYHFDFEKVKDNEPRN